MQFTKCSKKLPGQLSPDRRQNEVDPPVEPIHVAGTAKALVADVKLTKAHGSTLTPRFMQGGDQASCASWRTQTKDDFVPRQGEVPSKKLQQERCNLMRESAYLPLAERASVPFAQPDADVHSRREFQRYGPEAYRVRRMDRGAAHPSRSNVVLDADKDAREDVALRSASTMHEAFRRPDLGALGALKSKDARAENQQELMRSNWSYGEPDLPAASASASGSSTRSLAHCVSVAKQPLPTRDAALARVLPGADSLRPEDVKLPEKTFLDGQSGASAKYFSRVPYQSGCNLTSASVSPALLSMPGAGTTMKASFPRYAADAGRAQAQSRAGAENMGHTVTLPTGKKQYVPSSLQFGDESKATCYVTSQKAQFRGVWFDGDGKKK